jgi:hypothetical protein
VKHEGEIPHGGMIGNMLEAVEFVEWDRFTHSAEKDLMTVYGWIDRDDGRADFVTVNLSPESKEIHGYTTSSAEHSERLFEILFKEKADEHAECQRVENHMDVANAVRLEGEP